MDNRIQPPDLVHCVYTPERTVVIGGHYWMLATMYLSKRALEVDVESPWATNEDHHDIFLIFARLILMWFSDSNAGWEEIGAWEREGCSVQN